MKKILTLICTLLCANVIFAQDYFLAGQLYYLVTSNSSVVVLGYNRSNPPTDLFIPSTITYQGTTYSVTAIDYEAFCYSLNGGDVEYSPCTTLTSVTIPNSVTSIGNYAFSGCSSLTSVTIEMNNIPNLGNIGLNYTLQNLTLGENVVSIASGAFNNYSFLQNVTCLATNPPALADNTVFPYPNIATLTVPCGALEAYSSPTSFWNMFFMGRISEDGYEVVANVNNDAFGSVAIENNCSTATLTATATACYQFVGWNDGNTENPRLVTLSSDTTLTANFEEIVFDTTITATINAGEMYSEFGFNESEAGTYVQNLQTVNGCDSTITLILDVNSSLMDVEHSELSFFPNPTSSKVSFNQTIEKVEVIDLSGKTLFTFSNANSINIESLPSGAYYLRLTNNDKAIMQKIIKE